MTEATARQLEVGRYLTQVREKAGIKQIELAKKITWSPAVLSRVETGERSLAPDELQIILEAIGTSDALQLSKALEQAWTVLPRPPLDHPDYSALWEAEEAAKELLVLRNRPDVRQAFSNRLDAYLNELRLSAAMLMRREHQIAFIGTIGIGKSTAICRLTGLETPIKDGGPLTPVLATGAGGITICEVHLQTGPSYGIRIEPCSDDEIRAHVADLAEYILKREDTALNDEDGDSQGISQEIDRALRNMASLGKHREKDANGKMIARDDAVDLSRSFSTQREFVGEVLARMKLHHRDQRDIWYDANTGKTELGWLREVFTQINYGLHPSFTLPRRIEIVVPDAFFPETGLSVRIIDTKGVDRTVARADLEQHFDDPHTLVVLCSGFNSAGSGEPRLLLERAKDAGVRTLALNSSLLVLPHPHEALAMPDQTGVPVETVEEGYILKKEQAELALEPLGIEFSISFFNAREDDPTVLREFLTGKLASVRRSFRDKIHEVTKNARILAINHEKEQIREVLRQAAGDLRSWAARNSKVSELNSHIQDSLMSQMATAHVGTIRATIRRDGEWPNLSYSYHLGYGARRMAVLSLGRMVDNFTEVCGTLAGNPDRAEAKDLIVQAERTLRTAYEDLLRKVQLIGQASFRDVLKLDAEFWAACYKEWGRGSGYKSRVMGHNINWFQAASRLEIEKELRILIEKEWSQALIRVTGLLEN